MKKAIVITILAMVATYVVFGVLTWFEWYDAHSKFSDRIWWSRATVDERREVCHTILRMPLPNDHDVALWIGEIGNADSVPLLINTLSDYKPDPEVCTKSHIVDALETLTGCSPGSDYSDWKKWWENTGSKLPKSSFYPRIKPKSASTSASAASTSLPALSPVLP